MLYLRLFASITVAKYLIYGGILIMALFYAATTAAYGVLCVLRPGEIYGSPTVTARCNYPSMIIDLVQGAFGFVSDLYLFFLPMPFI